MTAAQYLRTSAMTRALVIGADQLSRWVDWDDRRSCVLFGGRCCGHRGCLRKRRLAGFSPQQRWRPRRLLTLAQTSERAELLPGMSHQRGGYAPIGMNGQEVYKLRCAKCRRSSTTARRHQHRGRQHRLAAAASANQRILDAAAERLGIAADKVLSNLANYGNTSAPRSR